MNHITLAEGSGGQEMNRLIASFGFAHRGKWEGFDDDAASIPLGDGRRLVFTTDASTVSPIEFPGGDIGKLAVCGTINDLAVMGAEPLGLAVAFILEEGFPKERLDRIVASVKTAADTVGVPVVTGDTKVMERGKVDGIVITTSGVGLVSEEELLASRPQMGDKVLLSGGIGDHAVALLSRRFDYETEVISDCKPVLAECRALRGLVRVAKDPTRGGIAAALNEISQRYGIGILLQESAIPIRSEVRSVTDMLGINPYELACEGRVICIAPAAQAAEALARLQKLNPEAAVIGEVVSGGRDDSGGDTGHAEGGRTGKAAACTAACEPGTVLIQTHLGRRVLPVPTGRIVPRIC